MEEANEVHLASHEAPPNAINLGPSLKSLKLRLFMSHFLSTWNSRLFEMGSVLFLASIFPDSLLPMSVYALVRNAASVLLSPALGSLIDSGDRLKVVRASIVGQRVAVVASCGVFWSMKRIDVHNHELLIGLLTIAIVLAILEKISAVTNLVSVERDWVVVIAGEDEVLRRTLNAQMRRIDLSCKLLAPLVISLIDGASTMVAIWVTLSMSLCSVFVEYFTISTVFRRIPALQRSAPTNEATTTGPQLPTIRHMLHSIKSTSNQLFPIKSLSLYLLHPAFLPSFSLALLYFTVLSFSGQMITFLLASGFNSLHVGAARTVSTVFELSATWVAPRIQKQIGPVRGGIWFLSWQMFWLTVAISWFFSGGAKPVFTALGLAGGVILSRIGLWGFDLCAQTIIQNEVGEDTRGAFSTVESSFQNLFELLSYVSTIVFSRPDQFRWPVLISVCAVYLAGGLYTVFVRRIRGHLLHPPSCVKPRIGVD